MRHHRVMMPARQIFISYRRSDAGGYAGELYRALCREFGKEAIFFDLASIQGADDFREKIASALEDSFAFIAVIGPDWLTDRIHDSNDLVRFEISQALSQNIKVIPALFGGAGIPPTSSLPDDVKAFASHNAVEFDRLHWEPSFQTIVRIINDAGDGRLLIDPQAVAKQILAMPRLTGIERYQLSLFARHRGENAPLKKLMETRRLLVLLGPPGMGKSIFLLRVLRDYAVLLSKTDGRPTERPTIPVYLQAAGMDGSLSTALLTRLQVSRGANPIHTINAILGQCDLHVLLDGLNEVSRARQQELLRGMQDLLHHLAVTDRKDRIRLTITSRAYGMEAKVDWLCKNGAEVAEIIPLDRDQIIAEFVRSLNRGADEGKRLFEQLDLRLRHFVAIPQQLDSVVDWLREGHPIEEVRNIGKLLQYCVGKRLRVLDELERQGTLAALRALSRIRQDGGISFSHQEISTILGENLLRTVCAAEILIPLENGYSFYHHSVQQYFMAIDMREEGRFADYVHNDRFHEPLAIMAGLLQPTQFEALLDHIGKNRVLRAYVLSSVHQSSLEDKLLRETAEQFLRGVNHQGRRLFHVLISALCCWLAFLVSIPILLFTPGVNLHIVVGIAAIIVLGAGPAAIARWHRHNSRKALASLQYLDLPELLTINRFLRRQGVMETLYQDLMGLHVSVHWQLGLSDGHYRDPRIEFLDLVLEMVEDCLDTVSLLTPDEKIAALEDPWIAASIDPAELHDSHLQKLCQLARSHSEPELALTIIRLLRRVYVERHDFRGHIAATFREVMEDRDLSLQRRAQAEDCCRLLGIPVRQKVGFSAAWAKFRAILRSVWRSLTSKAEE